VLGMTPRFSVVELVVEDMSRSLAFYRRLGLDIPAEADGETHVQVSLPGDLSIAWDTTDVIRSFDPAWTPPSGGHGVALAFACDSPAEVDSTYAGLVAAGYNGHLEPWDAFWGMRYAVVHDPDGHSVDLMAPLPAVATS
jgi:catechol 2,3-dioxygenase-like lactoylglutathione lyase family enzyme